VTTSGELEARNSVQITAPQNAQEAEAYQMRIASIVPEGTRVKAGDVVAELDRSTLAAKMAEVSLALQKAQAVYEQAELDSALTLATAREDIRSAELAVEEKRLAKEQSKYEAPTIQRQAGIDLERAERTLEKSRKDYTTKTEQAKAKMREVGTDLERQKNKQQVVQDVMQGFTIRAPAPGMVTYVREWNGRKRTAGSQVSAWDSRVATLPDLSGMESVTYVNEIDVRKVAVGQRATITLDADPSRKLTGKVASVANMGEQRPNADAKVFEVRIAIEGSDTTLRPGMTTGNVIETFHQDTAVAVSLEALHNEDSVSYVFHQVGGGVEKQEVETGAVSDDEVVILRGLKEGDHVLLTVPHNAAGMKIKRLPGSKRVAKPAPPTGTDTAAP
jgi:multidrug efflux pump subunit AcrA (membrane-fusion protein)